MRVRISGALQLWAAECHDQLNDETRREVSTIAAIIEGSSLAERDLADPRLDLPEAFKALFPGDRAERATQLVEVVAKWAEERAEFTGPPQSNPPRSNPAPGNSADVFGRVPRAGDVPIEAPAFLGSDRVDEEDDKRLYGGDRSVRPWIFSLVGLLALLAAGTWFLLNRPQDEVDDVAITDDAPPPTTAPVEQPVTDVEEAEPAATTAPAATPEPERSSFWADTTTILNSGSGEISASTYSVSPANRAVLTGHTAAVTGIVVSNDGRVLTSGTDNRIVDWGADVSLARPDVLNTSAPLTVLARTVRQQLVAGDTAGNVIIIDLVDEDAAPIIIAVHDAAISAITELGDGRLAVASVDGDVDLFAIESPDDITRLGHEWEVTAVVGLADGRVATAAVDGLVRLWPPDGQTAPATIDAHQAPLTSMIMLGDGRLVTGDVNGAIKIAAIDDGAAPLEIFHGGAVRALLEFELPSGELALASGADDSTIRLWDPSTGTQLRVLEGHGDLVSALNILPDGRLVSTSADATGRVWDLTRAPGVATLPPHDRNVSDIAAWNNDQFVTGGVDGLVVLASTSETTGPEVIVRHLAPVVGVDVMPNGDIVSLDAFSMLHLSQPGTDSAAPFETQLAAGATALDARESLGVVTGHADGTVRFNDFTAEVIAVDAHGSGVNDVVALSSGRVVSAGQDKTVRIIDFEDPERVLVFDLHTAPVDVVIELTDGRVASAGTDGIYVWSPDDLGGDHIRLNGHRATTISMVELPNNRLLSTAADGRVRLWDLDRPEAEPETLVDIPGIVNPHLIQAENGLFVAGAGRGYVVFTFN